MEDLLEKHSLYAGMTGNYELTFGENKILVLPYESYSSSSNTQVTSRSSSSSFLYRRSAAIDRVISEAAIVSDEKQVVIGVFPEPPLSTPKPIAKHVYLKFKSPVIVDQGSDAIFYAKMPIEIAVYRQSKDEEILLDAFSLQRQQYALYGSPESGVICRYKEVEVSVNKNDIKPAKYEEALVRIAIRNGTGNLVKVSKLIIPMENVILGHAHDETWLPGSAEMNLDHAFGKDIVNVQLVDTRVKRTDKTSTAQKEHSLTFLMDAGY